MLFHAMTKEQKKYMESLICQRLRSDRENQYLCLDFHNYRNRQLAVDLYRGWNKDRDGETAYYVIKDPETDRILLYFSLRCGFLHTPNPYDRYQADLKKIQALYDAARGKSNAPQWAQTQVQRCVANGESLREMLREYEIQLKDLKRMLRALKQDAKDDPSQIIIQTNKNYSGVEMVHFCKNDLTKEIWKNSCVGKLPMGETLFWYFILPIIQDTVKLVGCKFVYLFAADDTDDQTLVNYYLEKLHFERLEELSAHKPAYDVCCVPMCRKLTELERYQKEYIRDFNRHASSGR